MLLSERLSYGLCRGDLEEVRFDGYSRKALFITLATCVALI